MKHIFFSHSSSDSKAREIAVALRASCERMGFSLDTPFTTPSLFGADVVGSTFEQIKQATLVVAAIGDQRTNVLLDLGYALGMGKAVILIADVSSHLPLDLNGLQAIDYRSATDEIVKGVLRTIEKLTEVRVSEADFPFGLEGMLRLRSEYPERFERIPYLEFERAVKNAFARQGFVVEEVNPAIDYGFDFRIKREQDEILVEVKKNSLNSKVSIAAVQQLLGAVHAYEVPKALLICASDFTDSARGFAVRHARELSLWTASELEQFVKGQLPV
jgi:hypothetical protein